MAHIDNSSSHTGDEEDIEESSSGNNEESDDGESSDLPPKSTSKGKATSAVTTSTSIRQTRGAAAKAAASGSTVQPVRAATSPLQAAGTYIDDEGYEEYLDPGEQVFQEGLDHDEYSRLGLRLQEDGWLPLVLLAYEHDAATNSSSMRKTTKHMWILAADEVLSTVPPAVLEAMCARSGNLTKLYETTAPIKDVLDRYQARGEKQASIYVRELTVGPDFEPLTLELAEELAEHTRLYASHAGTADHEHAQQAYKIDHWDKHSAWTVAMSRRGERRFLQTGKREIDPARWRRWMTFARVLFKIVAACRLRGEKHIPTMRYVGYAINAKVRRQQHESFKTSPLCTFVQAFLTSRQNAASAPNMSTLTVCLLTERQNGPIAEMLLTRLARAYYFAGGFSTAQAGASMTSINMSKQTDEERLKVWAGYQEWVRDVRHTDYLVNQQAELSRRRANRQRMYYEEVEATKKRLTELKGRRVKIREAVDRYEAVTRDPRFERVRNLPGFPDATETMQRMKTVLEKTEPEE